MRRKIYTIFTGLLLIPVVVAAAAPSVTLDINPNPAIVGETVDIVVLADGSNIGIMALFINNQQVDTHDCGEVPFCAYTFNRNENIVGTYSVYARVFYREAGEEFARVVQSGTQTLTIIAATTPPPGSGTPPTPPSGGGVECPADGVCIENPLGSATFESLLDGITKFIFGIGMAIAPVMFIISGFLWVTSAGDPNRLGKAKQILIYTLIGLAVLLLARGLVAVLQSIIGVQ